MAAITDLSASNQLATTIPGSHLKVFKASPIVLEQRSLSTEKCELFNSIEHRIAPYADDLPATMSQNRNVDKAYRSISSLEAQHPVLCLGLQQEPLSRPQDVLALVIASTFSDLPIPNRFELLARLDPSQPQMAGILARESQLNVTLILHAASYVTPTEEQLRQGLTPTPMSMRNLADAAEPLLQLDLQVGNQDVYSFTPYCRVVQEVVVSATIVEVVHWRLSTRAYFGSISTVYAQKQNYIHEATKKRPAARRRRNGRERGGKARGRPD
eukprot:6214035-Pleurochrysis_carterae.AAC.1